MSKRVREMWERIKEAPREMLGELNHMGKHGAHELAAALFNGGAFVMYPRGHHDDPKAQQKQEERGGIEM
jgi:hypothetical protein